MRVNPRASGVAAKVGRGGHPRKTGTRTGGLGDPKSTERRWPLPSSRVRGNAMGAESGREGWRG